MSRSILPACLAVFLSLILAGCNYEVREVGQVPAKDAEQVNGLQESGEPVAPRNAQPSTVGAPIPATESLVPFNSAWHYPQILNRRPGDGLIAEVNPPRFSWPYLIDTLAEAPFETPIQPNVFTLQIAASPDFADLAVDVADAPYNFYNALAPIEPGTWYWRVGYGRSPEMQWSEVWSFTVGADTPEWDRSVIEEAVAVLAERPRPRSGPPSRDWMAYGQWLKTQPKTQRTYTKLEEEADRVMAQDWWNELPDSDVVSYTDRESKTKWVRMLKEAVTVAYLYRLTGDVAYAGSIDNILHMARWPRGGGLSPEALGGSTKMPSQAAELFAVVYDWFYADLRRSDRDALKGAIEWRLRDMYFDKDNIIWNRAGEDMIAYGLAYKAGSHPFQNFAWTVPAILLLAGDSEVADALLPLALHYLTGVTNPEGPEEGYNEGHGYSNEKGGTLLKAVLFTDLLLPELEIGKSPVIEGFTDWMIFMFPGAERLPWGDSWLNTARGEGGDNLRYVAYLTGSPQAQLMWEERGDGEVSDNLGGQYNRVWLDLLAYGTYRGQLLEEVPPLEEDSLFLPEAGWVFVQSQPIEDFADYYQAIGMQMQMRPRGGYGHSYPSDGSFVWYAYGQLLSCGGGWRSWASLEFSRDPISHNTLLIDGKGHRSVDEYRPEVPYVARPLAFEEGDGYTYWAADLTPGYALSMEGVERVHRHVVFLDKEYFVIFDDLQLAESAEPARFSWLYHVYQNTPIAIDAETASFDYRLGSVFAEVRFGNDPQSLRIENRIGQKGYLNPFTDKDAWPLDQERAASRGIFEKFLTEPPMQNNLWVSSAEPARSFQFLSVLTAKKGADGFMPELRFESETKVTFTLEDGTERSVSFDSGAEADIVIDVDRVRTHAAGAR